MGVRLKYAGVEAERIEIVPDLGKALDLALGRAGAGVQLYLLPTYTAMLEMREILVARGHVRPFWEN